MHRMQSDGWPYSNLCRDSSIAPSFRATVRRAAVFRSKLLHINLNRSLVPRLVRGRGEKSLVHAVCACSVFPGFLNLEPPVKSAPLH